MPLAPGTATTSWSSTVWFASPAAAQTGTPLLAIYRPAWTRPDGAVWHEVATMQAAADALGPTPRRVLLTVGQKDLAPFTAALVRGKLEDSLE